MGELQWIKLATGVFTDEKILLIEAMPGGDEYLVIWFKLLTLAGSLNNGGVLALKNGKPFTPSMFASVFKRDTKAVESALAVFRDFGMVDYVGDIVVLPNWSKHQSQDALEKKRERDRAYQADRRERQKKIAQSGSLSADCQPIQSSDGKKKVAPRKRKEKIDLEEDIYSFVVSALNNACGTNYKATSQKTRCLIDSRIKEGFTVGDFLTVIEIKHAEWGNDSKMRQYLRPETLFGTKFEGYLNQKGRSAAAMPVADDELDGIL